ncbi:ATP-binding protein [Bacillus sp. AK031]
MKEFGALSHKKLYYGVVFLIIVLMAAGLFVVNSRMDLYNTGYLLHTGLVLSLSLCLLLYPLFETGKLKVLIILVASAYFYMLFYLYPETWSTFIFICFIPALSILFFDKRLFYFTMLLNSLLLSASIFYIVLVDKGQFYDYIYMDITGNVINIIGSQIIIYFIFYLSDIRMERQRMYFEQLQNSERLKTTGQLAAAVAHEIRNPLTVVKGFLQFYSADETFTQSHKKNFNLMIDELDTAEQVISQFLTLSKPNKELAQDCVEIKGILNDVTELLKTYGLLHDNHIDLQVESHCFVRANSIELKQLFINLIKNAIEASPQGASILVKAERINDKVEIQVTDRGCGMSEEEVNSLGTPFYSLKSKGTGLGLMICFNITEKYNGTIHFASSKGKGTTVTIRFPFSEA